MHRGPGEATGGVAAAAEDAGQLHPAAVERSEGQPADKTKREALCNGSLGRVGGGRASSPEPDEVTIAKPTRCHCCQAALASADQMLNARYDTIELPKVRPVVTPVERYSGICRGCGTTTLATVPEGLEPGTPFSINIVSMAMYLRFTHATSYKRLARL